MGDSVGVGAMLAAGAQLVTRNTNVIQSRFTVRLRLRIKMLPEGFPVYITSIFPSYPSVVGFIGVLAFP